MAMVRWKSCFPFKVKDRAFPPVTAYIITMHLYWLVDGLSNVVLYIECVVQLIYDSNHFQNMHFRSENKYVQTLLTTDGEVPIGSFWMRMPFSPCPVTHPIHR